jgi:hypothetical protein
MPALRDVLSVVGADSSVCHVAFPFSGSGKEEGGCFRTFSSTKMGSPGGTGEVLIMLFAAFLPAIMQAILRISSLETRRRLADISMTDSIPS